LSCMLRLDQSSPGAKTRRYYSPVHYDPNAVCVPFVELMDRLGELLEP